jgi:signal transduction histidine kinase
MIFRRALVRLTFTYTLVQLLLFAAFAFGIYAFVTGTFDFDPEASELDGEATLNAAEQGFANLRTGLIAGYALLVVVVPLSSFVMARAALAPVRRSYELQQRFVDGVSHEFRTPLSVIQGELELALTRSRTSGQYRLAIAKSLEAADGLSRLTNDLLLLTRDNVVELEATFEPVELGGLVTRALDAHASQMSRITVDLEPASVVGSRELLARAIANVVDNAVKFTPAPGQIFISVSTSAGIAHVRVRDGGIGMTPQELHHAFDRFWRAEDARSAPGFGLGLALVRQICAAHHGTASIESAVGVGSTVTIDLPAEKL